MRLEKITEFVPISLVLIFFIDRLSILFSGIFYQNWKIGSFSASDKQAIRFSAVDINEEFFVVPVVFRWKEEGLKLSEYPNTALFYERKKKFI